MSKIQSKINFLEKKKTSARLQDAFTEKEKRLSLRKNVKEESFPFPKSPLKIITDVKLQNASNNSQNSYVNEKSLTDEHGVENKHKKNPFVLLTNTPTKCATNTEEIEPHLSKYVKSPISFYNRLGEQNEEKGEKNIYFSTFQTSPKRTPRKHLVSEIKEKSSDKENNTIMESDLKPNSFKSFQTPSKQTPKKNLFNEYEEKFSCEESKHNKCSESNIYDAQICRTPSKYTPKKNIPICQKDERYMLRSSPLKRHSPPKNNYKDEGGSPPKRECTEEETPTQFISRLFLASPERQNKLQSRKELFPKGEFDKACRALHSSAPTTLPGREDKLQHIKNYLLKHLEDQTSGILYISGPPGTGKTACVNTVLSDLQVVDAYKVVSLNCTTLNTCKSIYSRIISELRLKALGSSEKVCIATIEKYLNTRKRQMMLMVLDELDQLCSSRQDVLYSVFEWASCPKTRLVLMGIANALDLTDRVLPRLQARLSVKPTVLHFPSYSRQQIIDIITDRLQQAGVEEVFSGATLQLLAGKVAAVNGDVRRALDVARRVIEVAEKRTVLQPLSDNGPKQQKVGVQEVMSVVNDVYNTAQSLDYSSGGDLPLQQRLLICALLLMRQTNKARDITIGKLHEVYKKVCEKRNLSALDMSEFISLTSLVEARGIITVTSKKPIRLSKIVMQWNETEVKSVLQDKQLLAAVLLDRGVVL